MKISITGVTGDIGSAYLKSVDTTKHDVKALIREGKPTPIENIEKFSYQDSFVYDSQFLGRFAEGDVLIHFAALLNSESNSFVDSLATNALLTGLFTMIAQRTRSPRLVYVSSEMVYKLPRSDELDVISNRFLAFCRHHFQDEKEYDLRKLAQLFIEQNKEFAFDRYNGYALSKYFGEVAVQSLADSATLRISNAYGPEYANPRLIPRMIQSRLMGHDLNYIDEDRDFVYSTDIHTLINYIIDNNITGVIDCVSGEIINTKTLVNMIIKATPTAYGKLTPEPSLEKSNIKSHVPRAKFTLTSILKSATPFNQGFAATMIWHKEQTYHQMMDGRSLEDFLKPDEHVVKMLRGSSAAHLCIVANNDDIRTVRKIAIYDGVEGNGLAKVANEIKYYQYIASSEPEIASMYPRLIESRIEETFSSETIEYLPGKNFYESIRDGDYSKAVYQKSFTSFIETLASKALQKCKPSDDPETDLDTYYIERALTRLHPIHDVLAVQDTLYINDKEYIAPHIILAYLLKNRSFRNILLPRLESFCFHGDLTLLNTVFLDKTQEIKLIDPRGYIGNWDPLYDFGKMRFTLGGFGQMIIDDQPIATQVHDHRYIVDFNMIPKNARELRDDLLGILASSPTFNENIANKEPHWQHRIAFAEATHYLADIPFRLYTDDTTRTALDSYILGTYYLNQTYEALENELSNRN